MVAMATSTSCISSSPCVRSSLHDSYLPTSASPAYFCAQKEILGRRLVLKRSPAAGGKNRCGFIVKAARRVDNGRSYLLSSTLVAQEANVDNVSELCDGIRKWASEKMKDPLVGMKHFECLVDTFDKNVFHFWEQHISFLAMNKFRASPEYIKFMSDVRPYLKAPIALAAYEYKDGQIGHMLNPIGPKGEGGLDDATGQGGSGGGASYTQQSSAITHGLEAEPERNNWGLENILAKVRMTEKEKPEAWNLKTLFGGKK